MAERDCECKIITFVGNTSGMLKRYEILCNGTNGGGCLYDEIWSGEGIDNVARRQLRPKLIHIVTDIAQSPPSRNLQECRIYVRVFRV
jgi:hypothetical protein